MAWQNMQESQFLPEYLEHYFIIERPIDYLEFDSDYSPFEYLDFAKKDLKEGDDSRNCINSVSNAKRALHLQVETICTGYGYKSKSNSFPAKFNFLKNLGIVAPSIIEKLNKARNRIEHEYFVPNSEEASDFLDIIELFLYATAGFVAVFPDKVIFEIGDDVKDLQTQSGWPANIEIEVEKCGGQLSVFAWPVDLGMGKPNELLRKVTVNEGEYFAWMRQIFTHIFNVTFNMDDDS